MPALTPQSRSNQVMSPRDSPDLPRRSYPRRYRTIPDASGHAISDFPDLPSLSMPCLAPKSQSRPHLPILFIADLLLDSARQNIQTCLCGHSLSGLEKAAEHILHVMPHAENVRDGQGTLHVGDGPADLVVECLL
jgi:hypothetical protein